MIEKRQLLAIFLALGTTCASAATTVDSTAFTNTIGFNAPGNNTTYSGDSFNVGDIFSLSNGRYVYKRGHPNSGNVAYWNPESRYEQTFSLNISNLPAGAQWRTIRTVENGNYYNAPWQSLSLGANTITIPSVAFDRQVGFQIEGGANLQFSEFTHTYGSGSDSLALNSGSGGTNGSGGPVWSGGPDGSEFDSSPNIILIISDDHRWDATSYMQNEVASQGRVARFPWITTPNFDQLSNDGFPFLNAFTVYSTCSPSRATMLTGLYPHEHGVTDNNTPFPVESTTYATLLQSAGYSTGYFGKWHHGRQEARPGFNEVVTYHGQGSYYSTPLFDGNGDSIRVTSNTEWIDDVTTDAAIDFIQANAANDFMLVLGFKTPHQPFDPPARTESDYFNESAIPVDNLSINPAGVSIQQRWLGEQTREYMRTIAGIDNCIGNVMQKLDDLNIINNTVVIYISDNGFFRGEHKLWDKRAPYEESIRIPLIIHYPNAPSSSRKINQMALNLDMAPTILDIAGIEIPEAMQGVSLMPLVSSETPDDWRTSFFYQYNNDPEFPTASARPYIAIRQENGLKLVNYEEDESWSELYNVAISSDPYEINNLINSASHQDSLKSMEQKMREAIRETGFVEIRDFIFGDNLSAEIKLGKNYYFKIESSENLSDWSLVNKVNGNGSFTNYDLGISSQTNLNHLFLRVKFGSYD